MVTEILAIFHENLSQVYGLFEIRFLKFHFETSIYIYF